MSRFVSKVLTALASSPELIDSVLARYPTSEKRAASLAETLRTLWPGSALYACLLRIEGQDQLTVLDPDGQRQPHWAKLLRTRLVDTAMDKRWLFGTLALPREVALPGQILAVASLEFGKHRRGALALALRSSASTGIKAGVQALLKTCAGLLAAHLRLEVWRDEARALAEELAGEARLADVGELAGPVTHAINNFLNVVVLHVAVLEQEVSEGLKADLHEIRQQGVGISDLMKDFQQYRQLPEPVRRPLDLNAIVRSTVEELKARWSEAGTETPPARATIPESPLKTVSLGAMRIHLKLAADLPLVVGAPALVRKLVGFLVTHSAKAAQRVNGSVTVRTKKENQQVVLRVEDTGSALPAEELAQLFEPGAVSRGGWTRLELAACRSLARRLQCTIQGANRKEGGVAITVGFPANESTKPPP